jgi:prepilin-type N-terminal cleavage/methylation domain-containing protein
MRASLPSLRSRAGFTLIELITVVILIGVLSGIATMRYLSLENDGLAAKVGSEMQEIRLASINYFSEHEVWPAPSTPGVVPVELEPLLSGATQFTTPNYTLEWINQGEELIGVVVRGSRPGLAQKLVSRLVYGNPYVPYGSDVMYIIKAPGISM